MGRAGWASSWHGQDPVLPLVSWKVASATLTVRQALLPEFQAWALFDALGTHLPPS